MRVLVINVLCKGSTRGPSVVRCSEGSVLIDKELTKSGHNSGSVKDVGVIGGPLKLEVTLEEVCLGLSNV